MTMHQEQQVPDQVRQVAGLGLKAQVEKKYPELSDQTLEYIKERLLIAFYDPAYIVRKTVGSIMSMFLVKGGYYSWPTLIEFLTANLSHQD